MPTVRVRRNTQTTPSGDPARSRTERSTSNARPLQLGPVVETSDLVNNTAPQRRDSQPPNDSKGEDQFHESQAGGDPGYLLVDIPETPTAPAAQPQGRQRSNTVPQRVGGRSRSRTIACVLGEPLPPLLPPISEQGNVTDRLPAQPPLEHVPESSSGLSPNSEQSRKDDYQSRTERAAHIARVRGESITSRCGGTQVGIVLSPSSDRGSLERSRSRKGSVAADDLEGRIGLPTGRTRSRSQPIPLRRGSGAQMALQDEEHHLDEVVEHLDVIDPEVATVGSLQNCANSIMIPNIPSWFSRKPVLTLPETPSQVSLEEKEPTTGSRRSSSSAIPLASPHDSTESLNPYEEAEEALDKHVEHVLRKRDKVRRTLKGFWAFVKTPIGAITAIYGFLCAFWGAAIVLFLLGWINTGSAYNKKKWVEISSQVENGLFTVTGVGFIPWRVRDVYRIFVIWRLKRASVKLREKRGLPPIDSPDDLPDPSLDPEYVPVLTEKQQEQLRHQQEKFMASQTWYRPHATETHRAFSISWALWICLLVVGNSFFQVILCCCMWSMNMYQRPAWTTGTLIPASFLCGIAAVVMIWKGGERTKKTKEVEAKLRKALGVDGHSDSSEKEPPKGDSSSQRSESRSDNTIRQKQTAEGEAL